MYKCKWQFAGHTLFFYVKSRLLYFLEFEAHLYKTPHFSSIPHSESTRPWARFSCLFSCPKESPYNRTWQSHLTLRTRQLLLSPPLRNENCRFVTMAAAWRNVFSTYCEVNCDLRLWYYFFWPSGEGNSYSLRWNRRCIVILWDWRLREIELITFRFLGKSCINWPQTLLTGAETGVD